MISSFHDERGVEPAAAGIVTGITSTRMTGSFSGIFSVSSLGEICDIVTSCWDGDCHRRIDGNRWFNKFHSDRRTCTVAYLYEIKPDRSAARRVIIDRLSVSPDTIMMLMLLRINLQLKRSFFCFLMK